ncbi:FAD-dependent tricarballylate dehydrogenase TcuA [Chloroflexota bacterium]
MTANVDNCDVVVVGGGNTALLSAISASENGAKTLLLEKAPQGLRGGNGYFVSGGYGIPHAGMKEIMEFMPDLTEEERALDIPPYTPDEWYNHFMRITEGMTDPELLQVVAENANKTLRWIKGLGIEFELITISLFRDEKGRLKSVHRSPFQAKGGGAALSDKLYSFAEQRGVEVLYKTKATRLLVDSRGRVNGMTVRQGEEVRDIKAKAVILACGGFESNPEWRARYLGKNWDLAKVRGTRFNTGDGLKMALEIGAQPVGHWGGCHAPFIDADAPQPAIREQTDSTARFSYLYGVVVNVDGRRFLDEGQALAHYTYAKYGQHVLNQPQRIAFQLFDAKVRHLLEDRYVTATCITADSIEDLAEELGIEPEALTGEIEKFNEATTETPFDFSREDGKHTTGITPPKTNWAQRLDSPPYYAYEIACGISFTFGGLKISRHGQVLDTEDEIIPGLYASGEIIGGIFYNNYIGGSGQLVGAVFGRAAGAHAASF